MRFSFYIFIFLFICIGCKKENSPLIGKGGADQVILEAIEINTFSSVVKINLPADFLQTLNSRDQYFTSLRVIATKQSSDGNTSLDTVIHQKTEISNFENNWVDFINIDWAASNTHFQATLSVYTKENVLVSVKDTSWNTLKGLELNNTNFNGAYTANSNNYVNSISNYPLVTLTNGPTKSTFNLETQFSESSPAGLSGNFSSKVFWDLRDYTLFLDASTQQVKTYRKNIDQTDILINDDAELILGLDPFALIVRNYAIGTFVEKRLEKYNPFTGSLTIIKVIDSQSSQNTWTNNILQNGVFHNLNGQLYCFVNGDFFKLNQSNFEWDLISFSSFNLVFSINRISK